MHVWWLMIFGWVLAGVSISSELLQIFRASKAERSDGVSAHTVLLTLVVFSWWLCYSARLEVWPGVATDVVTLALAFIHARSVRALRASHWLVLVPAVLYGALIPLFVLGLSGTIGSMLRGGPQLVRTLRRGEAAGVSWEYWALQGVTGIGWLVYGLLVGAVWLGAFAVVSAPVAAFIAWRVFEAGRAGGVLETSLEAALDTSPETAPEALLEPIR
jgi:uncharacterized protein with PQ loop repeat